MTSPSPEYIVEAQGVENSLPWVVLLGCRHRAGYVGVPSTHPLFGLSFHDTFIRTPELIALRNENTIGEVGYIPFLLEMTAADGPVRLDALIPAHRGITYSAANPNYPISLPELTWWFGFDAGHSGDDEPGGRSLSYMQEHCINLAKFLSNPEHIELFSTLTPE